jgi:xanthine dehydrogenase accessory factor
VTRVSIAEIALLARFRERLAERGGRGVLAHLFAVEGSHYRRPGARMIFAEDGSTAGSISGGCLESDLAIRCAAVLAQDRPDRVEYDLRGSDDLVWGTGLGCAGRVEILLSPLELAGGILESAGAADGGATLGTAVRDGEFALGEQALLGGGKRQAGSSRLARFLARGEPLHGVLVEELERPIRLLATGAGEDVVAIVVAGRALGWDVRVFSARPTEAVRRRFAGLSLFPAAEIGAHSGARTAAVVATHNYFDDLAILRSLAAAGTPYVGLLGARARVERLLSDCGDVLGEEARRRFFGPAGLDIGADTPGEIALSIVAEIHSVLRGRSAGFLRDRRGRIHDREGETVPVDILQES